MNSGDEETGMCTMVPAALLMMQAQLSLRLAFLREGRDALGFEYLALAAAPTAAIWAAPRRFWGALRVPKAVAEHWVIPKQPPEAWLQSWVNAAVRASMRVKQRQAGFLLAASVVVLSMYVVASQLTAQPLGRALCNVFFLSVVDAALVVDEPCPELAAWVILGSHLMVCSAFLEEQLLKHSLVAIVVGIRFGSIVVEQILPYGMAEHEKLRVLQRLASCQERTADHALAHAAGLKRRILWMVLIGLLPGVEGLVVVLRRLSHGWHCDCAFPFQYKGELLDSCTDEDDTQPWCSLPGVGLLWGYCGTVGNHTEIAGYQGEEVCPRLVTRSIDVNRIVWAAWCSGTWQERVSVALLPAFTVGLLLRICVRELRQNNFRFSASVRCSLALVYIILTVFFQILPSFDCGNVDWESYECPYIRFGTTTATLFGLLCGVVFYIKWRQAEYRVSISSVVFWLLATVLILVGSPARGAYMNGLQAEDWPSVFFDAFVVEAGCVFVVWTNYFGTGHSLTSLGWASLLLGLAVHASWAIFLHMFFSAETTLCFSGFCIYESTLDILIFSLGLPLLFLIAIKGTEFYKYIQARDGCEEAEETYYQGLRNRCAWQLLTLLVPAGILVGAVSATSHLPLISYGAWLFLAHVGVGIFHVEYLSSPQRYPFSLKIAWVVLYLTCLLCAVRLCMSQSPFVSFVFACVATEVHVLLLAIWSQARASPENVRRGQGLFAHGVRCIHHAYDASADQLCQLRLPPLAARTVVIMGCIWSLASGSQWLGWRMSAAVSLLHVNLYVLWCLHCARVCDVPGWAAHGVPKWLLEEGINVWERSELQPDMLGQLVTLMEQRAAYVAQLEAEAHRGLILGSSARAERRRIGGAVECGALEWEFRFGSRLEIEMDKLCGRLPALARSIGLEARTIDDTLLLPETSWQSLMKASASEEAGFRHDQELRRKQEAQREQARQERERHRIEASKRRRSSVEMVHVITPDHEDARRRSRIKSVHVPTPQPPKPAPERHRWRPPRKQIHADQKTEPENSEDAELQRLRQAWQAQLRDLEMRGPKSFVDTEFPASSSSLGTVSSRLRSGTMQWVRLSDLFSTSKQILRGSKFISTGAITQDSPQGVPGSYAGEELSGDITQGQLGDCWLLSAMAVLCTRPKVLERVFLDTPRMNSSGAYCFRLFQRGRTKRVVVDDFVPVSQMGWGVQPVFARPQQGQTGHTATLVMWPLLLEKAFAKVYGSYGAIEAGLVHEALMDLTGGLGEMIMFGGRQGAPANLWARLCKFKRSGHLLAAGSRGGSDSHTSPRGIVQGHAYSIMSVREIRGLRLLKLRNPWGRGEWTGDFSDNSPLWTRELRTELRWVAADDGVFWMQLEDFLCEFECVFVCRIFPSSTFERQVISGSWAQSPQQVFSLTVQRKGPVCMQLEQTDMRGTGCQQSTAIRLEARPAQQTGRAPTSGSSPIGPSPFQHLVPFDRKTHSTPLTAGREVALEVDLSEGQHEIVAHLNGPASRALDFTLTVFSERQMSVNMSALASQPRKPGPPMPMHFSQQAPMRAEPHGMHWNAVDAIERVVELTEREDAAMCTSHGQGGRRPALSTANLCRPLMK